MSSDPSDPRLTPARPDIAAKFLEGAVDADRFAHGELRVAITGTVPLRRSPADDAALDTQILYGERFMVYDTANGWAWGQAELDRYVGFVPEVMLGPAEDDATHRVSSKRTFLYPKADIKAPPRAILSMNAKLTVAVPVQTGGLTAVHGGFVFADHIVPIGSFVDDYAQVAERFVGVPYLWGGKDSVGLDCSGLVQTALERAGVPCPRDSDMQERELGRFVYRHDVDGPQLPALERGDLVFWRGHVGVMLDEARIVHANAAHMAVTIEPLSLAANRIAPAEGAVRSVKRLI